MRTTLVTTLAAVLAFAVQLSDAAPPLAPVASADAAASQPAGKPTPRQRVESRATRSSPAAMAENNRVSAETGPNSTVVPQLSLTLRRDKGAPSLKADTAATRGGIDDDAARCVARETAGERAECRQRSGTAVKP